MKGYKVKVEAVTESNHGGLNHYVVEGLISGGELNGSHGWACVHFGTPSSIEGPGQYWLPDDAKKEIRKKVALTIT